MCGLYLTLRLACIVLQSKPTRAPPPPPRKSQTRADSRDAGGRGWPSTSLRRGPYRGWLLAHPQIPERPAIVSGVRRRSVRWNLKGCQPIKRVWYRLHVRCVAGNVANASFGCHSATVLPSPGREMRLSLRTYDSTNTATSYGRHKTRQRIPHVTRLATRGDPDADMPADKSNSTSPNLSMVSPRSVGASAVSPRKLRVHVSNTSTLHNASSASASISPYTSMVGSGRARVKLPVATPVRTRAAAREHRSPRQHASGGSGVMRRPQLNAVPLKTSSWRTPAKRQR